MIITEQFRDAVEKARAIWMEENPAEDGRDNVTPFDQFLYVAAVETIVAGMTKYQRSQLVYMECCAVDYGGLLEAQRMNADDLEAMEFFKAGGLATSGRIPAALLGSYPGSRQPTHWCELTDLGWACAAACRRLLALNRGTFADRVMKMVEERRDEG